MTDMTGKSEEELWHMSGSVRRSQHSAQYFSGSHFDNGLSGATHHEGGRMGGTNTRQRRRHRPGSNQWHMPHEGGMGSGEQPSHLPPPPPPPWPPPNDSLKNLLAQVAPQARIIENTSRLTSRASAQILSRVLSETIPGTPSWGSDEPPVDQSGNELDTTNSNYIGSASAYAGAASSGSRVTGNSGNSASASACNGPSNESYDEPPAGIPEEDEEDDDRQFMVKWQALFNRGSPLLDGTAADPFKEDLRRRGPPKWKKNSERPGHHSRYQQRRQKRETVPLEEGSTEAGEAASASTCEAVDLVFDASRQPPETVPAEKTSME